MTLPAFDTLPAWAMAAVLLVHSGLGFALGLASLFGLWRTVRGGIGGGRLKAALGAMLARLALVGAVLALTSFEGAGPLLATAFGVIAARSWAVRRIGRTS